MCHWTRSAPAASSRFDWMESGHIFLHRGANVLINWIDIVLDELYLQAINVGHTKPLFMDIDTSDHPSIVQKSYTLPLEHTQWVWSKFKMTL